MLISCVKLDHALYSINYDIILFDCCVDICVTKTTEGYTPLHLVARYNPYNSYESAEDEVDSDHTHTHTPAYKSQTSCKLAMKFLIAKNVDVC